MSRAVGETIGGKIRLPTASEAGSPAANCRPCSAALLTSGRNATRTSAVSTMFSTSLMATHQYLTRPYLVPSPRTAPLARQTRPVVSSGQTANSLSARKQSALVLSSSASRAVKMTTAMTTSIPIHTPADTICTTRTPLRVRAPNGHCRALPNVGLVITLPFLDLSCHGCGGHTAEERPPGEVGQGPDDRAAVGPTCPIDDGVLVLKLHSRLLVRPVLSMQVSVRSNLKAGSDDRRGIGMTNVTRESTQLTFREHQIPKAVS